MIKTMLEDNGSCRCEQGGLDEGDSQAGGADLRLFQECRVTGTWPRAGLWAWDGRSRTEIYYGG